jgi:hypothetical protein
MYSLKYFSHIKNSLKVLGFQFVTFGTWLGVENAFSMAKKLSQMWPMSVTSINRLTFHEAITL